MPAEAVIQKGRPIGILIRCKGYVAGLILDLNLREVTRIFRVEIKCHDTKGNANGEGKLLGKIDGKVRKLGHRKRLDTSIFLTVNDANWVLVF